MMENPMGLLARREYMQDLPEGWKRETIDQCVFGRDYKKATHLWHNFETLRLEGTSGDGRCHGRCGKGQYVGGQFRHFKAIAMEPIRGPRGHGHVKEKNALPEGLLRVVLHHALLERPLVGTDVVIDLCSGFQSWRPVAEELGCRYVAVDIMGDRDVERAKGPAAQMRTFTC